MYFDVNNLRMSDVSTVAIYLISMSRKPLGFWRDWSEFAYVLEVNLEYLEHLHDEHIDLLFCPTRDKSPGKQQHKLLATVYDKKRYVIHYRNLQQCMRHDLHVL